MSTTSYLMHFRSEIQRVKQQNFEDTLKKARGKPATTPEYQGSAGTPNSGDDVRNRLERNIEELSNMLGVEPVVLASAIAGVVKPKMPVESSESIASDAKASGSILSAFAEGMEGASATASTTATPEGTVTSSGGSVISSIASVVQAVGFDDQGVEID